MRPHFRANEVGTTRKGWGAAMLGVSLKAAPATPLAATGDAAGTSPGAWGCTLGRTKFYKSLPGLPTAYRRCSSKSIRLNDRSDSSDNRAACRAHFRPRSNSLGWVASGTPVIDNCRLLPGASPTIHPVVQSNRPQFYLADTLCYIMEPNLSWPQPHTPERSRSIEIGRKRPTACKPPLGV